VSTPPGVSGVRPVYVCAPVTCGGVLHKPYGDDIIESESRVSRVALAGVSRPPGRSKKGMGMGRRGDGEQYTRREVWNVSRAMGDER
jgi:hypothetical protein